MTNKSEVPSLSINDLEISDVDIHGLTKEDALGIPELGASFGTYGCCTSGCGNPPPPPPPCGSCGGGPVLPPGSCIAD